MQIRRKMNGNDSKRMILKASIKKKNFFYDFTQNLKIISRSFCKFINEVFPAKISWLRMRNFLTYNESLPLSLPKSHSSHTDNRLFDINLRCHLSALYISIYTHSYSSSLSQKKIKLPDFL